MTRLEAIADPVRLAIARYLLKHPGASANQIAEGAQVHLNTARGHLAELIEAGIAERVAESDGRRGRPLVRYRLVADWAPAGDELLPLSELLAGALLSLDADPAKLHGSARAWGRRWAAGEGGGRPVEARLVAALARLGFQAEVIDGRLGLSACPCPLVAPEEPGLVCAMADAVIDGVLEGSGLAAADRQHDPDRRRCAATLVQA